MDTSSKNGLSFPLGTNGVDGYARPHTTADENITIPVSVPLGCIFSSADQWLPLSMGESRITQLKYFLHMSSKRHEFYV